MEICKLSRMKEKRSEVSITLVNYVRFIYQNWLSLVIKIILGCIIDSRDKSWNNVIFEMELSQITAASC